MAGLTPKQLDTKLELQRMQTLFERLPAGVTSVMIGVFLVFLFLFPVTRDDLLKAWAAYMLTTLALRGWVWHMFRNTPDEGIVVPRWEWAFAGGMFLTGLGWAALNGPLYPSQPSLQTFVLLMSVITAFAGAVYASVSSIAFWFFVIPTLGSAIVRILASVTGSLYGPLVGAVGCLVILVFIHRILRRFALEHIQRRLQAEMLLAEQQAIFQAAPLGIVVISDKQIVKSNQRLGELFSLRLQELQAHGLHQLFADAAEAAKFANESHAALEANKTWAGVYRMRRADGSEFWAELSGRAMHEDGLHRSVWTVADVSLRVDGVES